jgi:hypothetical protein
MINELNENERRIRTAALAVIGPEQIVTVDEIRSVITRVASLFESEGVDLEKIIRNIEVCLNVAVFGIGGALGDDADHIDWLPVKRPEIKWNYWERYKHWLQFIKSMPPKVVDDLDDTTDAVLGRIEDPSRIGEWDRRGMVVGHVQSGKTGHYTGLICKAVDAGYRLIVVLAGSDNGLRSQTQLRIDEGFLGFTMGYGAGAQRGSRVGVGLVPEFLHGNFDPISLTTADQDGDFKTQRAQGLGILPGGAQPLVLVVKKNVTVLRNLIDWASAVRGAERDGVHKIPNLPILVIDDECDYASVNTKNTIYDFERKGGVEGEPTAINGLIRRLLHMFDQSSYVGYTATPFANIFIYHEPGKERKEFGEDLFPRSFILCLARSSEYMGADRVFGLRDSLLQGIESTKGLPILRPFDDLDTWIPPDHDRYWKVPNGPLPKSLQESILAFVLVCAARRARGNENEHNSMLLHLSRLQDVQKEIFQVIEDHLNKIKRAIRNSTNVDPREVVLELKKLWEADFLETTAEFDDPNLRSISWDEIYSHLLPAVEKIKVKVINGTSSDALDYYENRKAGVSVIAIGGAKLSRGLTLEGLSVSYFQRTTKMYDTLMQMGRWFGYRPGYADLCRLYTSPELNRWYRDIAMATEELYNQFEEMRILGATPKEFGLKVAQSPGSLLVTARVKMRNATSLKLSYAGHNPSYRALLASDVPISLAATKKLVHWLFSISPTRQANVGSNYIFKDLPVDGVLRFLDEFPQYPGVTTADPRLLAQYIRACNGVGDLVSWTVGIHSLSEPHGKKYEEIADLPLRLPKRAWDNLGNSPVIGTLWDPSHEGFGLTEEELQAAKLKKGGGWPTNPIGRDLRRGRKETHGLLVVYMLDPSGFHNDQAKIGKFLDFKAIPTFALSFPYSKRAPSINYVVRNDYWNNDDEDSEENR